MTKYSFILLSSQKEEFLERIGGMGIVDISRSKRPVDIKSAEMLEKASALKRVADILEKTDYSKDPDYNIISGLSGSSDTAEDTISVVENAIAAIDKLGQSLSAKTKEAGSLKPWGDFDISSVQKITDSGYVFHYYCIPAKKFDEKWKEEYPLDIINEDRNSVWFVILSKQTEEFQFPLREVPAPDKDWHTAENEAESIRQEIRKEKAVILACRERVPALREEYRKILKELDLYLADMTGAMAADNYITVLTGFAPAENDAFLKAEFDQMEIVYFSEEAVEEDNPPIKLKNNRFVSMFEVLTGMYGMPSYGEFDPTPVLAPFFLLFFSMCMGDAGYGILLVLIGLILKRSKGSMSTLGPLVSTLGVGTFIIGIFLGTFFGINMTEAGWVPQWLKNCMIQGEVAGYSTQMVLAIGIGIFHICLAMTIKAIGYTKRFGFKNTISTWGWLLLIVGGVCTAGLFLIGAINEAVTKWAVIIIGIVSALGIYIFNDLKRNPLINIGAGLWDTYNMATGLLGDVLSYLRLYALGLAGGMLGDAFNNLGTMVFDSVPVAGLNWLGFALILILGHSLNLAMSCLGAFVHPLRLTFVEYFKNSGYEGKGTAYRPLGSSVNEEE